MVSSLVDYRPIQSSSYDYCSYKKAIQVTTLNQAEQVPRAFVGRQPIFNKDLNVYAYELLFRSGNVSEAGQLDDNKATSQVIYNTLMEIGLDELVGNNLAFINFPYDLLTNDIAQLLPPERVVIEVLEDVNVDKSLIDGLSNLSRKGFKIALDDFVFDEQWAPVIKQASIIKIDVLALSIEEIKKHVDLLENYDVKLLAEKVETQDEYNRFREIGFDYFQGYFFSRPSVVSKDVMPDNHIALLQLLARLQDPDIEMAEIETLVSQTVSLNFKLFRYINSAFYGLPRKFDSIRQVIVYFGLQKLKDLASLIAMTGINDKRSELILAGLTRAKMCELLASLYGNPEQASFFIVGLFSILEALLDHSLSKIVDMLPLNEEIISALINKEGQLGEALCCSIACEQCEIDGIHFSDLKTSLIYDAYQEAMSWSRHASAGLAST